MSRTCMTFFKPRFHRCAPHRPRAGGGIQRGDVLLRVLRTGTLRAAGPPQPGTHHGGRGTDLLLRPVGVQGPHGAPRHGTLRSEAPPF